MTTTTTPARRVVIAELDRMISSYRSDLVNRESDSPPRAHTVSLSRAMDCYRLEWVIDQLQLIRGAINQPTGDLEVLVCLTRQWPGLVEEATTGTPAQQEAKQLGASVLAGLLTDLQVDVTRRAFETGCTQ